MAQWYKTQNKGFKQYTLCARRKTFLQSLISSGATDSLINELENDNFDEYILFLNNTIESNFNNLKFRVFKNEIMPISVDHFFENLVDYFRGDHLIL